jgi:hypothetical protein
VTAADGTPVQGVDIFVSTVFQDSSFFFVNAMTDPTGMYQAVIQIPAGQSEGSVIVSSIGCNGIFDYFTLPWDLNQLELIQDFTWCEDFILIDSCEVFIVPDVDVITGVITLYALSVAAEPVSYLWSDGSTGQFISVVDSTSYCVTLTDATGCGASSCFDVVGATSVADTRGGIMMLSPQPAVENCLLHVPDEITGEHELIIWGMNGQILSVQKKVFDHTKEIPIDVSDLNPGMYILRLQTGDHFLIGRLIKQ